LTRPVPGQDAVPRHPPNRLVSVVSKALRREVVSEQLCRFSMLSQTARDSVTRSPRLDGYAEKNPHGDNRKARRTAISDARRLKRKTGKLMRKLARQRLDLM
jgi:hypothetical protein